MNAIDAGRQHLVVGVDGSENSRVALEWALTLAEKLGLEITAVTTWHYVPQPASLSLIPPTVGPDDQCEMATSGAKSLVASYAGGRVAIEHRIVRGDAASMLV